MRNNPLNIINITIIVKIILFKDLGMPRDRRSGVRAPPPVFLGAILRNGYNTPGPWPALKGG